MKRIQHLFVLVTMLLVCSLFMGCKTQSADVTKLKDLEFTVVTEDEMPEELKTLIDQKKEKPFRFSYYTENKDYLYIAVGYGQQSSGGYSITVDELFLSENAVYINTNLLGPTKDDVVTQNLTYPYVVVKIEYTDKSVTYV